MDHHDHPVFVNEKRAAGMLGVSISSLRRWRRERRGPKFTHLERCVRYEVRSLEEFAAQNSSDSQNVLNSTARDVTEVRDGRAALR
jgi:hypothetical protein